MPVTLNEFENKVMDYLIKRKTAATIKQIAKFFIRSDAYISRTLLDLEKKELISVNRAGTINLYSIKE